MIVQDKNKKMSFELVDIYITKQDTEDKEQNEIRQLIKDKKFEEAIEKLNQKHPEFEKWTEVFSGFQFLQKMDIESSIDVWEQILRDDNSKTELHFYLGMNYLKVREFKKALRECKRGYPNQALYPDIDLAYADALIHLNDMKKAYSILKKALERFEKDRWELTEKQKSDVHNSLLLLSIEIGNPRAVEQVIHTIKEDITTCRELNEDIKENIAFTIVEFSKQLHRVWVRPYFLDFISFIDAHGCLQEEPYARTMKTAYTSYESYIYNKDKKMHQIVRDYIQIADNKLFLDKEVVKDKFYRMNVYAQITAEYLMAKYYKEHEDIFTYIQEKYPYSWKNIAECAEQMINQVDAFINTLHMYIQICFDDPIERKEAMDYIEKTYNNMMKSTMQ